MMNEGVTAVAGVTGAASDDVTSGATGGAVGVPLVVVLVVVMLLLLGPSLHYVYTSGA